MAIRMQVTPEDLYKHYATLSDEMLEQIDPADLTDMARQCYESEFAKRGLRREAGPPPAGERDEDGFEVEADWIEHAECACSFTAALGSNHAPDAQHALEVLEEAGIPCQLSKDSVEEEAHSSDLFRLLVPASLNLKAMSVLDKEIFNADLEADWATHFAELSDTELRALNPDVICAGLLDRAERLTRVYREEIARRSSKGA